MNIQVKQQHCVYKPERLLHDVMFIHLGGVVLINTVTTNPNLLDWGVGKLICYYLLTKLAEVFAGPTDCL